MQLLLCSRHHFQVKQAVKTLWPANHLNSLFFLWSRWMVFLLLVLLLSGRKVQRSPLPAPYRPAMDLSWLYWPAMDFLICLREARWSTCAGLYLSCLTLYRSAEKPKMVSTSSSSPIHGLRPRIRGWSVISTEAGLYICKGWSMYLKGEGGGFAQAGLVGGGEGVHTASEKRGIRYRWSG